MKDKLKEKYLPKSYRNHLLDELHNLHQGNMFVQNNTVRFDDLTLRCDVKEDSYQIIYRFCSGLTYDVLCSLAPTMWTTLKRLFG